MTTEYAQDVHTRAREDMRRNNFISYTTERALNSLGYTTDMVAALERRIRSTLDKWEETGCTP